MAKTKIAKSGELGAPLAPAEACRRLEQEPSTMIFTFHEFMLSTGMSWPQMLGELQAGRLTASRFEEEGAAFIACEDFITWIEKTGFKFPPSPTTH